MDKNHINAVFVILDVGLMIENSSVFQSQVVDQVIALKKFGYSALVLCVYRNKEQFQLVAGDKLNNHNIQFILVKDAGLLKNIIAFSLILKNLSRAKKIIRIYIRGFWAAFPVLLAAPIRRLSYVYDVRGDSIDESIARGRARVRVFFLQMLENFALRRASCVTSVSGQLAKNIASRAGLNIIPDIVPSCIDLASFSFSNDIRTIRRAELGYKDEDIVLVFSGGMAHYQMIPEMLALWRGLLSLSNNIKFLLMINSDPSSLGHSLGGLDAFGDRLNILNLPRATVYEYLCAADIGFLLREDRPLNATSSPVKFAEYLAAGLSVISSPGVGDISKTITGHQLGVLVSPSIDKPEINRISAFILAYGSDKLSYRNRALEVARKKYSWTAYKDTYDKIYASSVQC